MKTLIKKEESSILTGSFTGGLDTAGKPCRYDILLIDAHRRYYDHGLNYFENIGLYLLASYADSNGYSSMVTCGEPFETLLTIEKILSEGYCKVVGFYCDYDNQFEIKDISKKIKKDIKDNVKIIIGGPQAEFLDDDFFKESNCDYIVRGDGEITLVELLNYITKNKSAETINIKKIKGITYRSKKGLIVKNTGRSSLINLDSYPTPQKKNSLNSNFRNGEKITLLTSRGCNLNCAFCFETTNDCSKKVRYRSVDSVFKEINTAIHENEKLKCIVFIDSNFTSNISRTFSVCERFNVLSKKLAWVCESHIKPLLKNKNLLTKMINSGLFRIQIGIESGVDRILNAYNKHISTNDVEEFLNICVENSVPQLVTNFIIGGAFETETTFYRTLSFAEKLIKNFPALIDIYSSYLFPYPGTAIAKEPQKFGLKIIDALSFTSMSDYPVVETSNLNKQKIFELKKEFDQTIINLMKNLVPKLNYLEILKHCKGFYDFKIKSLWFEVISQETNIHNFMNLMFSEKTVHSSNVSDDEMPEKRPVRVIDINLFNFDYNNNLRCNDMFLDKEETLIFELCSAKLSVKDIVLKIIENNPEYNCGFYDVYKKTTAILKKLEKNYMVTFCK